VALSQLNALSCNYLQKQLYDLNHYMSIISRQLSAISYQLSAVSRQPSAVS